MLFILTGDIQIGKTRWLTSLYQDLSAHNVDVQGVIAPGQWIDHGETYQDEEGAEHPRFEKTGINNLLLPQNELITFGLRRDLAQAHPDQDFSIPTPPAWLLEQLKQNPEDTSLPVPPAYPPIGADPKAKGWAILDSAILHVNQHLAGLTLRQDAKAHLLIVDELGQLELLKNEGLTSALDLLEQGPASGFGTAIVVVRDWLAQAAQERFGAAWGQIRLVSPDDNAKAAIKSDLGL